MLHNIHRLDQRDESCLVQEVKHSYESEGMHDYMNSWNEAVWVGDVFSAGAKAMLPVGRRVLFPEFNAIPIGVEGWCLIKSDGVLAEVEV